MEAVFIFPHQLFYKHPGFKKDRLICLIEHPLFFKDEIYPAQFHKQKIWFHRVTMKAFEKVLKKKGYKTVYFNYDSMSEIKKLNLKTIHLVEFDDFILEKRIRMLKIPLEIYPSPGFLTPLAEFKKQKQYLFQSFYIQQRKRLELLLDRDGKPLGGKWSFDSENRKKVPKTIHFPSLPKYKASQEVLSAKKYVEKHFPQNPGTLSQFFYPTTHAEAKRWLKDFLEKRLKFFGDYEDAILQDESVLFHSLLSPLLNVGLLTPQEVIDNALEIGQKNSIPMNSLEGFIRQVIGWREFIRGIYSVEGSFQRNRNFFKHKRKLPRSFYEGTTGIIPFDKSIKKLEQSAYLHHIERLMIVGNFFLLCEIDPNEVYRWFMELFIDAYDWVMVPNVYGMSQYADGGLMTTKPYLCGSNYILKMSDYPKGEWTEIWDSLFWRFMYKHLSFFKKQPRLQMLCKLAQKKGKDNEFMSIGETFLESLK